MPNLNANYLFDAPTQPDLPTRCPSCHAFLKRDWEYEEEEIEDERRRFTVTVFYTQCRACGDTHRVYA